MNLHIPDTNEIHMIAFLTMRGWELVGGEWRKEGKTKTVKCNHPCGCCDYDRATEWFDTESAYWEERGDD